MEDEQDEEEVEEEEEEEERAAMDSIACQQGKCILHPH